MLSHSRSDDGVGAARWVSIAGLHADTGLHVAEVWLASSMYPVTPSHGVHVRSRVTHGSSSTRSPGPHLLHGVHRGALVAFENVLGSQLAHSRSLEAVWSAAMYWPG